jgi:hypothetical protein
MALRRERYLGLIRIEKSMIWSFGSPDQNRIQ